MKSLKQTLMDRDNITESEALECIKEGVREFKERKEFGESLLELYDNFLAEEFGLEPDYWDEFLSYMIQGV